MSFWERSDGFTGVKINKDTILKVLTDMCKDPGMCPLCNSPLKYIPPGVSQKGVEYGWFTGCSSFPNCKYTHPGKVSRDVAVILFELGVFKKKRIKLPGDTIVPEDCEDCVDEINSAFGEMEWWK